MKAEIYGATWCVYCKSAISLCESKAIEYSYFDVDEAENLKTLEERVGGKIRSVPQIFLDGQYISGGFNGLKQELTKI